jgi:hypothetical protein
MKWGQTYLLNGTYVTFQWIFSAIFSHTRPKIRHASKNGVNRIKGNVPLPIVLQVTQVPLGLYTQTDRRTDRQCDFNMPPFGA